MSGETGNLVAEVNVKKNVEEGPMMASAKLLEAWVSSGKADSVSDKASGVIWVASGLSGLVKGYPSHLDALSAEISLIQHGRPMRKFLSKASWRVPGRVRKSGKVAGYDRVGRSLVEKRSG
jgi:hypothetical protein